MPPINNCRLDLEDREMLAGLRPIPAEFATFGRPESVDVQWHHTENQGSIGSCQGNDLSSCLERLEFVSKKAVVQLSRIFAYLATQKIDGLLGADNGSTISGGGKLATTVGCCPEDLTGYPKSYPGSADRQKILSQANYDAGAPFKAMSLWKVPRDPDEAKNWIGGGGAISIGIRWPGIPNDRVIRSYHGGSGGHAQAVLGYDADSLIAVNSWGDGAYRILNAAWVQMWDDQYTAMVGLAGAVEPVPVNWLDGLL